MKEKIIKVYEFEELTEEIKEKVLNYFREQEDFYFLDENLKEQLVIQLDKNKIKVLNDLSLDYSLSYCQGDGLSFTGLFEYKKYMIKITKNGCQYSHYNSVDIEFFNINGEELSLKKEEKIKPIFKELYKDICKTLEKIGYDFIDYALSDEVIKENIKANEYTFRANGEMENL